MTCVRQVTLLVANFKETFSLIIELSRTIFRTGYMNIVQRNTSGQFKSSICFIILGLLTRPSEACSLYRPIHFVRRSLDTGSTLYSFLEHSRLNGM